ncbi:Non-reducing end beta-L-arabinofuranosidase [Chryseobacterium oranimense G311]|uniref:glycoside hydrolase family 127 protein n=1 Tax=Chryseobacterium oranimense TaxID=421058 RepID=UPI0005339594|nr:glycoside hydrolase family 127 protein [Chryseobacterium oranimense]CEJ68969.1 Non-reducing end beta-L-arabinofuranosidase [Chryseobacterium oranimense G311]
MTPKLSVILLCFASFTSAQVKKKINYFPLETVRLSESVFNKAMMADRKYLMAIEPDRLLAPYLKEAGLKPKADNYPNWENTGLDGHIGGHYLSALSLMYASTGDAAIQQRIDYMISELERCQNTSPDGYISGVPDGKKIWKEIKQGNIRASGFGLNDRWVPLYNIHKLYSGLRDAYWYAKSEKAKAMLIRLTDWMMNEVSNLSDEQIQDMLRSEHGGLNEVFADVYDITHDQKYLKLAHCFSHQAILSPLLTGEDKLTGLHANTQIPKVIGYKRIADLENNESWSNAADFFWHNVTEKRSSVIGGNSVSEHFNPVNDFSSMIKSIEGPETCNTYNMLKLTKELYATQPESYYIDYYEKALYNHILSTENHDQGGFVYFTPMRPGHYRVYSQPQTSFWCCVGSGMENHAKYGEMIYARSEKDLYVNLFIPSTLTWKQQKVVLRQVNNFPEAPETTLIFDAAGKSEFDLKLRCPEWTTPSEVKILINGKQEKVQRGSDGYFTLTKKWKKGDVVKMTLPMHLSAEQLPDHSNYYAFKYGPVVLAAKYGTENQQGLLADDSRGGHIAYGPQIPLNEIPVILGNPSEVVSHVTPLNNKPLNFAVTGLYPSEKFGKGLDLVPFYSIQAERYILYWPQADKNGIESMLKQRAKEEAETRKLDMITADKIQLGEQQPESDHFIESKDSGTGYMEDRHFRDAKGWFSYQMKNNGKNASYLYLLYFDANPNRTLNIEINGKKIMAQNLEGKSGALPQYLVIPIPDSEKNKENLTVKFLAEEKLMTAKVIEVRLLRRNYEKK